MEPAAPRTGAAGHALAFPQPAIPTNWLVRRAVEPGAAAAGEPGRPHRVCDLRYHQPGDLRDHRLAAAHLPQGRASVSRGNPGAPASRRSESFEEPLSFDCEPRTAHTAWPDCGVEQDAAARRRTSATRNI